jgi:hypothetical protein
MSQVKQNRRKQKSGIGRKKLRFLFWFLILDLHLHCLKGAQRAEIIPNEPEQVMLLREKWQSNGVYCYHRPFLNNTNNSFLNYLDENYYQLQSLKVAKFTVSKHFKTFFFLPQVKDTTTVNKRRTLILQHYKTPVPFSNLSKRNRSTKSRARYSYFNELFTIGSYHFWCG